VDVKRTSLPEVLLLTPRVFEDGRGFFVEAFNVERYASMGLPTSFVQDNHSRSTRNVLRGLHYQLDRPQGKLVRVIRGSVFDVAVDIRRGSPTFGQWAGVVLDDVACQSVWIPPGYAHGFCALSDVADVVYKCTDYYHPPSERGIRWDDPLLAIAWPVAKPIVSDKDDKYPALSIGSAELPLYVAKRG
jgi:dTDP-4-dehydrorhamnose 3,5-epimerase